MKALLLRSVIYHERRPNKGMPPASRLMSVCHDLGWMLQKGISGLRALDIGVDRIEQPRGVGFE
jgi:hypothetical protein